MEQINTRQAAMRHTVTGSGATGNPRYDQYKDKYTQHIPADR